MNLIIVVSKMLILSCTDSSPRVNPFDKGFDESECTSPSKFMP